MMDGLKDRVKDGFKDRDEGWARGQGLLFTPQIWCCFRSKSNQHDIMLTFWEGTSKDSADCYLGGLGWNVDAGTSQNLPAHSSLCTSSEDVGYPNHEFLWRC